MVAAKQLLLVVEGNAALATHWNLLRTHYLDKIVRSFCGYDNNGQRVSNAPVEMVLIRFFSHGPTSDEVVQQSPWTQDMGVFLHWLDDLVFSGGGVREAAVAEGLAEALCLSALSDAHTSAPGADRSKHCVLVSASPPVSIAKPVPRPPLSTEISRTHAWWMADAASVASVFSQPQYGITLSVFSPRSVPALRSLYINAKRNPLLGDPVVDPVVVDSVKLQHIVALVSEGFIEARLALHPTPDGSLHPLPSPAPPSAAPSSAAAASGPAAASSSGAMQRVGAGVGPTQAGAVAPGAAAVRPGTYSGAAAGGAPLASQRIPQGAHQLQPQGGAPGQAVPAGASRQPGPGQLAQIRPLAPGQQPLTGSPAPMSAAPAAVASGVAGAASAGTTGPSKAAGQSQAQPVRPPGAIPAQGMPQGVRPPAGMLPSPGGMGASTRPAMGMGGPQGVPVRAPQLTPLTTVATGPSGMAPGQSMAGPARPAGMPAGRGVPMSAAGQPLQQGQMVRPPAGMPAGQQVKVGAPMGVQGGPMGAGQIQAQMVRQTSTGPPPPMQQQAQGMQQQQQQQQQQQSMQGQPMQQPQAQQQPQPMQGVQVQQPVGGMQQQRPGMTPQQQQPAAPQQQAQPMGVQQQQGQKPMMIQQGQQQSMQGQQPQTMVQRQVSLPQQQMAQTQPQQMQQQQQVPMQQAQQALSQQPQQQQQQQQQQPMQSQPQPQQHQQQQQSPATIGAASAGASGQGGQPGQPSQAGQAGQGGPGSAGSVPRAPGQGPRYTKLWEGLLAGERQKKPVEICRMEGYRQPTSPENLAADWPSTMRIVRLISQDYMNSRDIAGRAELLVFRPVSHHVFLQQMADKKLCAVIMLPSHTLLLASVPDRPGRLIGMLFPKDMVVIGGSNQQPQLQQGQGSQAQPQQQQRPGQQQQQQQAQAQQSQQQQSQQPALGLQGGQAGQMPMNQMRPSGGMMPAGQQQQQQQYATQQQQQQQQMMRQRQMQQQQQQHMMSQQPGVATAQPMVIDQEVSSNPLSRQGQMQQQQQQQYGGMSDMSGANYPR